MKKEELLKLNFVDKSYKNSEGNDFENFQIKINEYTVIQTYGIQTLRFDNVDILIHGECINVPNCKTIEDYKNLIKLFA